MSRRRSRSIHRLSVPRLVRLLDLEKLALMSRRTWVIRTAPKREIAIHFSLVRIGIMRVDDPIGKIIPFFSRKDAWKVEFLDPPRSESHSRLLIFNRHKTVYTVRRGGTPMVRGWAIDLMPIFLALATLLWPIRFAWRWCWRIVAPTLRRIQQRWKTNREILRQFARGERCPNCGYDLRATANRCPECGISFARKTIIVPSGQMAAD